MKKLPLNFYDRNDVVQIARELLGKIMVSNIDGKLTSGIIVETEAYVALVDKASHAFGGRRTQRNEHMYGHPATSYVYICYGMHRMVNIVTNKKGVPDAVLIRALEPLEGIDVMLQRTGKAVADFTLTRGPGNVGKAMGIEKIHSGLHLMGDELFVHDAGKHYPIEQVGISKRIGVESAGKDALNLYRFYIRGNRYVSGSPRT
ncbi:MAG: DNA-3-methyladenine glycosylase [Chitinophagaceae bacterium]|nr:MAG: DNA-3-methyladenine glycosylase [Chitinophagaceae bacterium]